MKEFIACTLECAWAELTEVIPDIQGKQSVRFRD